jgi:hypothetical protein
MKVIFLDIDGAQGGPHFDAFCPASPLAFGHLPITCQSFSQLATDRLG